MTTGPAAKTPPSSFLQLGGKGLCYTRLAKTQAPAVLLLHGYPENHRIWFAVQQQLSSRFDVTAIDWPGLGKSEAWRGGATPHHLADRIPPILDALEIDKAHLVGMDMGGQPALVCAAKHEARLHSVTVMNSLVMGQQPTSWEIQVLRKHGLNNHILRHLPRIVFRRAEQTFLPGAARLDNALKGEFWEDFRKPEVRKYLVRMCAAYQGSLPRLPQSYAQITLPTLLLWGARDKHFPPSQAQALQQVITHAKLQVLPDAGHWMALSHSEEIAAALGAFFASCKLRDR